MVLDITFDLETCALCPTAAVMSIAAVAWHRAADATPFIGDERFSFRANIDLKSAFVDGFTFDADRAKRPRGTSLPAASRSTYAMPWNDSSSG